MRKRWSSGGQDFCIVCACFVVVASACVNASAQDAIVITDISRARSRIAHPIADLPERAEARIEAAKHPDHFSGASAPQPPVRQDRAAVAGGLMRLDKKAAERIGEVRTKIKQENIAHDEIKKSADEVRQEVRLIAAEEQGITFEQRQIARNQAAECRRQLRYQLVGNVVRQQKIDDGLEEAKRVAREQARKLAEEAKSLTVRE
jgi:hypothetical protein